jgi:hypothetical protein
MTSERAAAGSAVIIEFDVVSLGARKVFDRAAAARFATQLAATVQDREVGRVIVAFDCGEFYLRGE